MTTFKLIWVFFRIGILNELQYRVNFFIQLLESAVGLGVGLFGLSLVFGQTTNLAGWTRPELLAVMGVHILMGGYIRAFIQPNMQQLMGDIQEGTLDFTLTKPEDSQTLISVRSIRLWQMVDIVVGGVVLSIAVVQMGSGLGLPQALGFAAALLLGAVMLYSFWLILTSTAFWVIRVDEITNLFEGIYAAGRWPVGIYPDWLRASLTFLVPVAFAVTVPAEALTGRLNEQTLLGAALLALALLGVARFVWRRGLRAYSGASA